MTAAEDSPRRADFRWFVDIPSRWGDNDAYGHINNVVYWPGLLILPVACVASRRPPPPGAARRA